MNNRKGKRNFRKAKGKTRRNSSARSAASSNGDRTPDVSNEKDGPLPEYLLKPHSRALRRKHLDDRLRSLQARVRLVEGQLRKLEGRFYRICIFGSARIKPETKIYDDVATLARLVAREGIDILTGGGPGLMEAANKGAQMGKAEGGGRSISFGLSIQLDWEPVPNPHLDVKRHHHKFSSRLDDFMRLSYCVVCTPGGIGTLLELLFAWQLIQVKHMEPKPIILMDRQYWSGFLEWVKAVPIKRGLINLRDLDQIVMVDTPEEVLEIVLKDYEKFLKNKPMLERLSREF